MSKLDIWLCRVLLHAHGGARRVQELHERADQLVMAKVIAGELGTLQDGTIIEPVSAHATESDANEARERARIDSPGDDWRVVVTMQVGG